MTLYRHFATKDDLVVAVLQGRDGPAPAALKAAAEHAPGSAIAALQGGMSLSMDHQAPIELCREHSEVVPAIVNRLLQEPLPYYSKVRVTDPNTRTLVASGKRSDAAVILEDNGRPVLGAILEPQGSIDADKWYVWPKYTADLHAELRCETYLVVLALTRRVAAWAREPIRTFQPGHGLRPYVVGPDEIPSLGSVEEARAEPWLAALAALMHANEKGGAEEALLALRVARETAGPAWRMPGGSTSCSVP